MNNILPILTLFLLLLSGTGFTGMDQPSKLPAGLELIEMPAVNPRHNVFAVILSGDGGWAKIDRSIAADLVTAGVPVTGLDSLHYFWKKKSPEQAGRDLGAIIHYYSKLWGINSVVLIGYSRGADVLPFMVNSLTKTAKDKIKLLVLIAPAKRTDFVVHLSDILNYGTVGGQPVLPEIGKLLPMNVLCFYGEDEKDSLAEDLKESGIKLVKLKGAHHFNGDYRQISSRILDELYQNR